MNLSLQVAKPWKFPARIHSAFIKRLIKVLVARNLFLLHSSSCKNNRLARARLKASTCEVRFHLWIYYNAWSNLTQEIQFLEFIGGSNIPQAFPNYLICLHFIRISTVYPISHIWVSAQQYSENKFFTSFLCAIFSYEECSAVCVFWSASEGYLVLLVILKTFWIF